MAIYRKDVAQPGYELCNLSWVKGRRFAMKNYSTWCCLIIGLTFSFFIGSLVAGDGWAKEAWEGKVTYTKTPPGVEGPALAYDSYIAIALQPRTYGCRNKEDVKKNLDNACRLIDEAMYTSPLAGGEIRLVSLTEGSIQGMWDEYSDMDQSTYCKEVAITIPGPEIDRLADKAKQYKVYLVAQAKIVEPELMPDRYFNQAFIISPEGEIILRHVKNVIGGIEGTTSPYDVWDIWAKKVGTNLENFYPVVKTEIGNLAVAICAETFFPETFRALSVMGAEVIVKMAWAEPCIMDGYWEVINRARALDNVCYIVAPNFGPYFTHPGVDAPYMLAGGHSMIVDYRGNIVRKADHGNTAFVPGEINIKGLREYRANSPIGSMPAQMRSSLWKQIYERWPEYPKNLYLNKTYPRAKDRNALHNQAVKKLCETGVYALPKQ
jgi:predicted amidohydrolase